MSVSLLLFCLVPSPAAQRIDHLRSNIPQLNIPPTTKFHFPSHSTSIFSFPPIIIITHLSSSFFYLQVTRFDMGLGGYRNLPSASLTHFSHSLTHSFSSSTSFSCSPYILRTYYHTYKQTHKHT
ncbi:hypothetical protein HDV62DRAFT_370588 [Trichoderma sp. SZMC 28011]